MRSSGVFGMGAGIEAAPAVLACEAAGVAGLAAEAAGLEEASWEAATAFAAAGGCLDDGCVHALRARARARLKVSVL
jgi:hypothetical protein